MSGDISERTGAIRLVPGSAELRPDVDWWRLMYRLGYGQSRPFKVAQLKLENVKTLRLQ